MTYPLSTFFFPTIHSLDEHEHAEHVPLSPLPDCLWVLLRLRSSAAHHGGAGEIAATQRAAPRWSSQPSIWLIAGLVGGADRAGPKHGQRGRFWFAWYRRRDPVLSGGRNDQVKRELIGGLDQGHGRLCLQIADLPIGYVDLSSRCNFECFISTSFVSF